MAFTYYKIAAFSGDTYDGEIGVEVASQSITGKYSMLNLAIRVRRTSSAANSYNLTGSAVEYIKVDGVSKVTDDMVDFRDFTLNTWYTVLSVSGVRVNHNTDGTKTASIQGYIATGVSAGTYNQTQAVTLPAIPVKSTATVTASGEVNGTNQATCSITRYDASFLHTVTFYFGDFATTSYKQAYTDVATSQAYAIPTSWLNAIPNAMSGQAKVRVETFSGATSMGYNEYTFDITVPSTVIPVVTDIAFAKVSDAFSAGIYAKGISKINVTGVTATNQYSATTASFKAIVHPDTYDAQTIAALLAVAPDRTDAFELGPFTFAGAGKVAATAKDSRTQVSARYSESLTVYDYAPPSVTVSAERCDAAGNPDPNGGYIKMRFQASISPVNNDNSKVYTLKYKRTIDSTWTSVDVSGLTTYTPDQTYIRAASASYTWEVQGSAQDKVNTVTKTVQASTALVLLDFLSGGTGAAFGKVAETADLIEFAKAVKFNLGVEFVAALSGAGLGLTDIPFSYHTTVAAATAAKGTFSGGLFLGQIIDLILDEGNTAASPTIIIGGVTYSISGMPTVAKISTSSNQTYKLKKTAATTLTFIQYPDYVCEYGTDANGWSYRKMAGGDSSCERITGTVTVGASVAFGSLYVRRTTDTGGSGSVMPAIFNSQPLVNATYNASGATVGHPHGWASGTGPYTAQAQLLTTANTGSAGASAIVFHAVGKWK